MEEFQPRLELDAENVGELAGVLQPRPDTVLSLYSFPSPLCTADGGRLSEFDICWSTFHFSLGSSEELPIRDEVVELSMEALGSSGEGIAFLMISSD